MKRPVTFFLLIYYTLGALFLPAGNFSSMTQLPDMYRECQSHEHHDMNMLDFFTDHLFNLDGVFDQHGKGDAQKPHKTARFAGVAPLTCADILCFTHLPAACCMDRASLVRLYRISLRVGFTQKIYHPPIA